MYLKSLEMQGFKSFPDKTKLTFDRGTAVIVGPNGSGKSNISDAMRWVLGEVSKKSLRSTNMEDIIFGGADSRRQMGFAEVSVTFDNTDPEGRLDCPDEEVTVTRRYFRGGESEYFINRRACRLRDIYELFLNTGIGRDGYSIIGQGKIAEIISRKSEERRSIFEDASGIAKYRNRKNESERKLATTEENMTRVTDIFREIESQVGPLEKEAERAKRALELKETQKKADVQLWLFDSERLRAEIAEAEKDFTHSTYDLRLAEEAIANFQAQSDQLSEESQSNRTTAAEVWENIQTLTRENNERQNRYLVTETNMANTAEKINATSAVIEARTAVLAEETAEGERRRAAAKAHEDRLAALEAEHTVKAEAAQAQALRALDIAGEIATALADIEDRRAEITDVRVRMQVLETGKQTDSDKHDAMQTEIDRYREISAELAAERAAREKEAESYRVRAEEAEKAIVKIDAELSDLGQSHDRLVASENETRLAADIARQRIEHLRAMEEHFEGYGQAVRYVMEAYANGRITDEKGRPCGRIYGPLSKVITVEQPYAVAIEVALGNNLQHIVVEDESVAKAAIYALKQAEMGRTTFYPVSTVRGQSATAEMDEAAKCRGYIGVASDLVGCEDRYRDIVSHLLGRTVVFDTLDHAIEMANKTDYRVKAVTLDGQVINAGGSFTGGSYKQKGGILTRGGEIAATEENLKTLTATLAGIVADREALEERSAELQSRRADLDARRQLLGSICATETGNAAGLAAKWEANEALITKLQSDFDALERQRVGYDEELARLAEQEKALQRQIGEIDALRAEKDVERNGFLDRKTEIEGEMTTLVIAIHGVRKDIETANTYIAESDARADALRAEIEEYKARIAAMRESIESDEKSQEANRNTYAEGEKVLQELHERHRRLTQGSMDYEKKLAEINAKMHNKMAEKETIVRAYDRSESKLNNLRREQDALAAKFDEDYAITRAEALALGYEPITAAERSATVELATSCRRRLNAMGPVDLAAVDKYKEVKARYDEYAKQIADMTAARDDLLAIIRDLETQMRTEFLSTFEKINENFNRTFSELFGGGTAELSLTDPDDVLASGIEIKAAPPGKIIKNLVQLSGGEQAFIAIALLFAIMQVNPTPFFVLDEIEAALDEVNVARFAAYIKRYSQDTQFILITHRRGTMEVANRLYGVTMPTHGISKVLALDVKSIRGKQEGDDWSGIFSQTT